MERRKKHILSCTYRPDLNGFPNIALPVYPRSTGHFHRFAGFEEIEPEGRKNFVQFFWCVRGEGEFEIDGSIYPVRAGDAIYRLPLESHILRSCHDWEYRWITFDGPGARDFMLSYGYSRTGFFAGECPHENFLNFDSLLRERTPYAWRRMVAEITLILASAGGVGEDGGSGHRIVKEALRICRENFRNSALNVNSLAETLCVDRSTLRRIFQKNMNQLPSEYLAQLRLQHAFSLLKQTFLPLKEIAERSGFQDVNYFCRVIQRQTGHTPSELRN